MLHGGIEGGIGSTYGVVRPDTKSFRSDWSEGLKRYG